MKKIFSFFIIFMISLSTFAFSEPLKIATGSEKGVYFSIAGNELVKQAGKSLPIELVVTKGSMENIDLLKSGAVQAAIIQNDVLISRGGEINISPVTYLYPEYVHFLVKNDGKISSIKDLTSKDTIAVGPVGTGNRVTWDSFCKLDKTYADIPTQPIDGAQALAALENGQIQGILMVSGLGSGHIMRANAKADAFKLANVDDWDFDGAKYRDKKIYVFDSIDSKAYPNLFPGIFNNSVKTLKIDSVLVVNTEWMESHPSEFEKLFDIASASVPNIKKRISEKK